MRPDLCLQRKAIQPGGWAGLKNLALWRVRFESDAFRDLCVLFGSLPVLIERLRIDLDQGLCVRSLRNMHPLWVRHGNKSTMSLYPHSGSLARYRLTIP